ncbi:Uncharacterised protein [Brevibacterium casei]|jgi:hypothetical protein|uniref:Uncharacterized protein n=3 Tax=Brevibacterium TaxID=1696 RepID=A0A0B8ZWT8_BRELN|nr:MULTISPECIES: hypothetical protein [Brevibacterium]KHS50721.1 hypothetical protein AE0388_2793 [Brevibacterium linens]VEW10700.1 Uncharacterised protein [Brevibacterium casei]HHX46815.1 hypothetical protein [Brevibacterium sp.]HJE77087.1 hypothetical protein [Brevibacterium epidermidis]
MIDVAHPRDLVMIGAIFGLAAFIWSGWAQEAPPKGLVFRIVLAGLGVAGLALAVPSILTAIGNWSEPSAFTSGTSAFTLYLIVFWVEVIIGAVASFFLIRTSQTENIAPLILAIVGVHFFALAVVFGQPVLHLAGLLLTIVAVLAFVLPRDTAAPSFWCGILGAPVFLGIGLWCLLAGYSALTEHGALTALVEHCALSGYSALTALAV